MAEVEPGHAGRRGGVGRTPTQLLTEAAGELGNLARRLVECGQADVAEAFQQWRTWAQAPVPVVVVGEVKRGKSTLVNALAGQALSPAGVDVVTQGVITVQPPTTEIPHGQARLTYADLSATVVSIPEAVAALSPTPVSPMTGVAADPEAPILAQLGIEPRWVPGAALLDTPGVGGLIGEHGARVRLAAERAGVLLFVSDGGQVLTRPELDFLRQVGVHAEYVVFALTKVDRTDGWEAVRDENRRLLTEHAARYANAPVVPVAAVLAESAWSQDAETARALESASQVPVLAGILAGLTGDRRRVAVAKALRIAISGFDRAAETIALGEAVASSTDARRSLVAEQTRLAELNARRSSLLRYLDRDISRARDEAQNLMNTLIDEAVETMSRRAQSAKRAEIDAITDELRMTMRDIIEQVRERFLTGLASALEAAYHGLEPPAAGQSVPDGWDAGDDLGRVVTSRTIVKTGLFDPSIATFAFMGSHLVPMGVLGSALPAGVLSAAAPFFAPVFAAGWVAVNLAARRSREGRQQLSLTVNDSLAVLRRDLPRAIDGFLRELRPDVTLHLETALEKRIREVNALLEEAKRTTAMDELDRRNHLLQVAKRKQAIIDLRTRAETLLAQIARDV